MTVGRMSDDCVMTLLLKPVEPAELVKELLVLLIWVKLVGQGRSRWNAWAICIQESKYPSLAASSPPSRWVSAQALLQSVQIDMEITSIGG